MEALLLTLNGVMMVLVVYMGLRDERRRPGTPLTSFFRMTEEGTRPEDAKAAERQRLIARSRADGRAGRRAGPGADGGADGGRAGGPGSRTRA